MSNLRGFWNPSGRGFGRDALNKPAKEKPEKKKKYTKIKCTLITSREVESALTFSLHPCDIARFANWLVGNFPTDAKHLRNCLNQYPIMGEDNGKEQTQA